MSFAQDGAFIEPFSSLLNGADLAGLQDVDGLDELTGPVRAAAEFPQYPPGLSLHQKGAPRTAIFDLQQIELSQLRAPFAIPGHHQRRSA
ncbi:hypothetical protein [Nocardia yunnanensis]|uniref:hypothetical protein n=1 Tax=Nocardia yunnanensis TaxID=2382165 RepID=UPI0013C4A635|nr:hypothetical protein [Nocardia yunnanensis]